MLLANLLVVGARAWGRCCLAWHSELPEVPSGPAKARVLSFQVMPSL